MPHYAPDNLNIYTNWVYEHIGYIKLCCDVIHRISDRFNVSEMKEIDLEKKDTFNYSLGDLIDNANLEDLSFKEFYQIDNRHLLENLILQTHRLFYYEVLCVDFEGCCKRQYTIDSSGYIYPYRCQTCREKQGFQMINTNKGFLKNVSLFDKRPHGLDLW